jgi:hypothetical protein
MSGGNAGNAGNLQSLGNSGIWDRVEMRRKLAEIGGNPLPKSLFGKLFAVSRSHFGFHAFAGALAG